MRRNKINLSWEQVFEARFETRTSKIRSTNASLYQNTANSVTFASSTIRIFTTLHSVILHRFHTGSGVLPASYPFGTGSDGAGTRRWQVTQFHLHRDQECVGIYLHAPSAFIARCLIKKQGLSYYAYHNQIVKYNTGLGRSWDRLIPESSRIPQCPNELDPSELTPKWKRSDGP